MIHSSFGEQTNPTESHAVQHPPIDAFIDGYYDTYGDLSGRQAVLLLMYTDVPMTPDIRAQSTAHTLSAPNTVAYAQELQTIATEIGVSNMKELARTMSGAAVDVLEAIGIHPTDYTRSPSWAMHDMAKQRFMARQPHDDTYPYADSVGDMITQPGLRYRAIDRMVGWEIDLAARRGDLATIDTTALIGIDPEIDDKIFDIISNGRRSENPPHELSSEALGELGAVIRNAVSQTEMPSDEEQTDEQTTVADLNTGKHRHTNKPGPNPLTVKAMGGLQYAYYMRFNTAYDQHAATERTDVPEFLALPATPTYAREIPEEPGGFDNRASADGTPIHENHTPPVAAGVEEIDLSQLDQLNLDALNEMALQHSMVIPPQKGTPAHQAYIEQREAIHQAISDRRTQRRQRVASQIHASILGPELESFRDEVLGQ